MTNERGPNICRFKLLEFNSTWEKREKKLKILKGR